MFSRNEEIAKKRGYRVDRYGNAFNKANKKVGTCSRGGYYYFAFRVDGEIRKVYIHRMQAFQKYGKRIYEDGILEQIKIMRENGATYNEIMAKFNISSKGTLSYIVNKRLSSRVGETAIISL